MKRTLKYYRIMWWKHDFSAGLSVFFVALPLCLGIALASGAPVYSGILAGVIGGIVTALISGSDLSVSGPAAGLSTLVAAAILDLGSFNIFLVTVIIAGFFQIALGTLKLGILANYFPSAVIKGMLAAIGVILISKQIPLVLGYDQPDFWTSGFLDLFSSKNFLGNLQEFSHHITMGSIIIGLVSFVVMICLERKILPRFRFLPNALFIVVLGMSMNAMFGWFIPQWSLKTSQLINLPGNLEGMIQFADFINGFSSSLVWKYGLMIGALASLESLLCIEAIDKLDRHHRITPVNRELLAQGIGNVCCGLLGAIPITAVVVRGAANVDAGGRTKLSAITHGLFLLIAVFMFTSWIHLIPYASLAVILIMTGFNLVKPKLFIHMWQLSWKQFLPFVISIIIILATDLLLGVSIGLMVSIYFIIQNNFKAEYKVNKLTEQGIPHYRVKLNTNVTFLNKVNLKKVLDDIPEYSNLTIDGSDSHFIDYDILEIISEFETKAKERHIVMHLINIERVNVTAIH